MKPHTVEEEFILSSASDMCTEVVGVSLKMSNQLKVLPLSLTPPLSAISYDLTNQLMFWLKSVRFSIQLDEITDITNKVIIIICVVRYFYENEIHKDFLFSTRLKTTTTGR